MIYVLKLEHDKYYIGCSDKMEFRIQRHMKGNGSSWTKLYRPVCVLETLPGDKIVERDVTLKYMQMHGWENVRGAGWTARTIKKPICFGN